MEITNKETALQAINNIATLVDALNISGRKQALYVYNIGLYLEMLAKWLNESSKVTIIEEE